MSAPSLPTDHEEYAALAAAWAVGALEPADQAAFDAHRDGCDICTVTMAEALRTAAELAYAVPDVAPPDDLRRRVLAAAVPRPAVPEVAGTGRHRSPETTDPMGAGDGRVLRRDAAAEARGATVVGQREADRRPAGGPGRRPGRGRRRVLSLLAAVALVGVSAVTTWEITRPAAPVVAAERVATLTTPEGDRALATVVSRSGRVNVVTDGLAPNAGRGTRFVLWGVPASKTGAPEVVGSFEVTATGLQSYPVRLSRPLDDYPVLAVSEEPAGSTPTTPIRVLARGPLG